MTTCRSKRDATERIIKLRDLIERWNKGVSMLNSGQVPAKNAAVRFNNLADEIAKLVDGYDDVPEIEFLIGRWNSDAHENPIETQRSLLSEYYEKWESLEVRLENSGDYDRAWREGFDAAILRTEGKETS
jgi:hypothetical protein